MLLYGHPLSGNTHKVRLLMGFLALPFAEVAVDIPAGEGRSPDHLSINPLGQVPVLVDGALTLRDAQAILVYLGGRHSSGDWWPTDPSEQGQVMQWLSYAANEIQNGLSLARLHVLLGVPADLPTVQHAARASLAHIDRHLAGRDWLEAGRPTIADCACAPYTALSGDGGVSLDPYPAVIAWLDRLKVLPGFTSMPGFG